MKELENISEIQQVSFQVLSEVADICEREGLCYFLMYGTLIGAIRHNGFIPWDDDIDIMMPRKDYDKLVDFFLTKYRGKLKIFTQYSKKYPYMIARISNTNYEIRSEYVDNYGIGAFIDVYPLDGMGKTMSEAKKTGKKAAILSSLCFLSTRKKIVNSGSFLKRNLRFILWKISRLKGKMYFFRKIEKLLAKNKYDDSNYVGCPAWYSSTGVFFEKKYFEEYIKIIFNGKEFNVPKDYDYILRVTYGDYMTLPPEKDRIAHHYYKMYKK